MRKTIEEIKSIASQRYWSGHLAWRYLDSAVSEMMDEEGLFHSELDGNWLPALFAMESTMCVLEAHRRRGL